MTRPPVVVGEATTLEEVARIMLAHSIGGVPVVDPQGKVVGIITESDFTGTEACIPFSIYRVPQLFRQWIGSEGIEQIYRAGRELTAREVMRAPVVTASEKEPVTGVVKRMIEHDISRVPIVRDGVPVGIVARHDLLRLMVEPRQR
jgi:CBS domain-containing protein